MKSVLISAVSFLCLFNLWYTQPVNSASFTIDGVFTPHTGADVLELDSGLVWDGSHLWLGYFAAHKVEKWDVSDAGKPVREHQFSTNAGISGMAWDGTNLLLTKYPQILQQYDMDGNAYVFFSSPDSASQGITWGNHHLWLVGEVTDRIYQLSTSGDVVASFTAPGPFGEGLSWMTFNDKDYLWYMEGSNKTIYLLDVDNSLSSGTSDVALSFSVAGITKGGPQGLAWDGSHLWYSTNSLLSNEQNQVFKLNMELFATALHPRLKLTSTWASIKMQR